MCRRDGSHGRIRGDRAIHLELEDALGTSGVEVDVAFQQMVFHTLNVIGTGVFLAVQTERPFLRMVLILGKQ